MVVERQRLNSARHRLPKEGQLPPLAHHRLAPMTDQALDSPSTLQRSIARARPVLPLALIPLSALALGFSPSPLLTPLVLALLSSRVSDAACPGGGGGGGSILARASSLAPSLALGLSLAYLADIRSALGASSSASSVVETGLSLLLVSTALAVVPLGAVAFSSWIQTRGMKRTPVARVITLPVVWTSLWALVAMVSPFGAQVRASLLTGAKSSC